MQPSTEIICINWFNHHDDKYLKQEYTDLEKVFADNEDKIKCLHDCEYFAVFQYDSSLDKTMAVFKNGLFEPEYHSSVQLFKEEYFEYDDVETDDMSDAEFFSELEYQKQLERIGTMAGDDEREFDRLWTQAFVFGDANCISY